MPWHKLIPASLGGGRQPKTPSAKLYATGQFTLSHATVTLLGDPARVRVEVDPEARIFRLTPTTPSDNGGFSLAGGGNSPHRLSLTSAIKRWPELAGEYRAVRSAGGVELRPAKED
jgi:hypothetical protein